MQTQQTSRSAYGNVNSNHIFPDSPSPSKSWTSNQIWSYQLTIIFGSKQIHLGLISRQQLTLIHLDGIKKLMVDLMADEKPQCVIKSKGKLKFKYNEKESKIKSLDRFCRFLMLIDRSGQPSDKSIPNQFLIPFFQDNVDWKRIGNPFERIPSVKKVNELSKLQRIFHSFEANKMSSLIVQFEFHMFISNYFQASNILNFNQLSSVFWKIPNHSNSRVIVDQLEKIEIAPIRRIGIEFIRMIISMRLFICGGSVKLLTDRRSSIQRSQHHFPKYDECVDLLGSSYFHKGMEVTLRLAYQLSLNDMERCQKDDWIRYIKRNLVSFSSIVQTDAEKELQGKLGYWFKKINLLRRSISRDPSGEFRRLEWLGDALLGAWSIKILKQIQDDHPEKIELNQAFVHLTRNSTLRKWADEWLHPKFGLVKIKDYRVDVPNRKNEFRMRDEKFEDFGFRKKGKNPDDTPGDLVEALIAVLYLDLQFTRAHHQIEIEFHRLLIRMFEKEIQQVKDGDYEV
ncbi:hypothetical protein DFH28DRAFT_1222039 [Melampsora americana]|nr:hypothetical protein DFH28DRAFT_1222039 [Melampsora americana]